jgi:hypothetical protein
MMDTTKRKCADIRYSFRATKQVFCGGFEYVNIYSHMDKYLAWSRLSLMQQLNCICDTLVKKAITTAIIKGYHDRPTKNLPRKDVALFIWGSKVMGNISSPLRFHASKEMARSCLQNRLKNKWPIGHFNKVDWEHLDLASKNNMNIQKNWHSKQSSGFCSTRVKVGLYSGEAFPDEQCPNCRR